MLTLNYSCISTLLILQILMLNSCNPVKMCLLMVSFSLVVFAMLITQSGSMWFSMIFALLFIGGVIIMFMILSSVMPNEKFSMKKGVMLMSILAPMLSPLLMSTSMGKSNIAEMKHLAAPWNAISSMTTIVILYFAMFIYVVSTEKVSMRTNKCQ